jgi:fucose permease
MKSQIPRNTMETQPFEDIATSVASKSMGGGAATSILGWISSNEGIALIGLGITVAGFIVNFVFQFRRDRREAELLRQKLRK